jgi:hypothetical protein
MRLFAAAFILTLLTFSARAQALALSTPAVTWPINVSSYSTQDEKLEAVLSFVFKNEARLYGWPANYQSLWCPTNVFNLLKRLDQAHVDLSNARVWYILPTPDGSEGVVHPRVARPTDNGRSVREWSFHVVLEIDGRILDLDFTSRPDVVSVVSYAGAMWEKGPMAVLKNSDPLYVREIPARVYLSQYKNNWSYFQTGAGGRYPAVEMSELLDGVVAR